MNREELKNILPHREPMLLLDSAEVAGDGSAHGTYLTRGDEWFFGGHFPGEPTLPGVILCEMAGQASCVLFAGELKGKLPLFAGMNKVKFRRRVRPGELIELVCRRVRSVGNIHFIEAKALVGGELCMSGELSFAVVSGV